MTLNADENAEGAADRGGRAARASAVGRVDAQLRQRGDARHRAAGKAGAPRHRLGAIARKAVADSLAARPSLPAQEWYARRERSANGDTIRFRIYRAKDANLLGQMLRPEPVIAGGAVYVISKRELRGPGIGVR